MAQADRVLSTPRTNTPTSHDRLESAPGAVQLSPRALIRTSPPAACQALPVDSETLPGSRVQRFVLRDCLTAACQISANLCIAKRFWDLMPPRRDQKLFPHLGEAGTAVFAVQDVE
jgi:hypothetical protein